MRSVRTCLDRISALRSVLTERVYNLIINVMVGADNDSPVLTESLH